MTNQPDNSEEAKRRRKEARIAQHLKNCEEWFQTKKDVQKIPLAKPASSTSTKIFEKRFTGAPNPKLVDHNSLTGSARYFIPEEPHCSTKSSLSSKEWDEIFLELYKMTSEKQSNREEEEPPLTQ